MKKKLKKPSIRTVNHRDGGMSFYEEGGQPLDGFKKRLMNRYPGMQGVYGSEGQNLNIIKDPNYAASDYGYGDIEFIQPGNGVVNYSDDYQYQSPTPDKYTAVYNPKGANRGDVFLDMMHGMRNDPEYMKLLQVFDQNVKNARGNDMQYFYDQEANNGYADGQDQWNNNYIDGQLRAQLAPGTIGMFSKGRKDYRQERKYDTPEMEQAAQDIRNYLKGKYAKGGELPRYATQGEVGSMLYPAPSLAFQNAVNDYLTMTPGKKVLNVQQPSKNQPPVYSGLGTTKRVAISNSDNTRVQTPVKDLTYDQFKSSQDAVKVREQQGKEELARRYALRKAGINDLKSGKLTDNVFNAIQELPHLFSDDPFNHFDDINPLHLATNSIGSIGKRGLDPYNRILRDPIGTAFDVADMALLKGIGQLATPVLRTGLGEARNAILAKTLSSQMNKGIRNFKPELPGLTYGKRIDPINRSSVNVQNDFIKEFGTQDYDNFINNIYNKSADAYDAPLIEFKGSKPASFITGLGSDVTTNEGRLFKEKFCAPGSECAKTANAVTNGMYTDITNQPFDALGNANNAWHMEEQMIRNGGVNVTGQPMKVGDRVLMGNGVDQSTYSAGFKADPRIRHAGVFAGMQETPNGLLPMVLESGKNSPLYFNPVFETFTGPNSIIENIRPQQFLDNNFGKSLVDKNIRYAYRNKPSVASYSSGNTDVQNLLNGAEDFRETIKRSHDITNDEFNELLNNLVSIGGQETKLNGLLPGSNLAKAKIQLQNKLNEVGLLKPIKQSLNSTKKVLNAVTAKNSNLPKYPGSSKLEMEAAIFSSKNNIPFEEALAKVKSNYQSKPKFSGSTIEPSKGMFRQKYQTQTDRLSNFGNKLKNTNSLENGLGQMAENYNKIKKMYPNANPRELMDLTTLMWNSPGKAMDKNLVDFYMFGKNNPNPSKFNFDYINKVNKYRDKYIDVKPNSVDPHFEYVRNGYYPEIQYNMGGGIELSNRMFEEGGEYELSNEEIQDLKRQGYDIELL